MLGQDNPLFDINNITMKEFKDINDILDFAINEEQKAIDFYNILAEKSTNDDVKTVFIDFVKEEMNHKARLEKIKAEKQFTIEDKVIADLKIADYLVSAKITSDMKYEDALVIAMKKEKAAFKLYMDLAEKAPNAKMKSVFISLAQEESKHKLKFEIEYDEFVMREN